MLLEERDLFIIGLMACIVGIGIILLPLLRINDREKNHISLSVVYQLEECIIRGKISFITGLVWIICGFIIQLGAHI